MLHTSLTRFKWLLVCKTINAHHTEHLNRENCWTPVSQRTGQKVFVWHRLSQMYVCSSSVLPACLECGVHIRCFYTVKYIFSLCACCNVHVSIYVYGRDHNRFTAWMLVFSNMFHKRERLSETVGESIKKGQRERTKEGMKKNEKEGEGVREKSTVYVCMLACARERETDRKRERGVGEGKAEREIEWERKKRAHIHREQRESARNTEERVSVLVQTTYNVWRGGQRVNSNLWLCLRMRSLKHLKPQTKKNVVSSPRNCSNALWGLSLFSRLFVYVCVCVQFSSLIKWLGIFLLCIWLLVVLINIMFLLFAQF